MKNSNFRDMYSPTFNKDGIKMKFIGNWQDLVAYYEGSDGNAWAYHKSGGSWSNKGDINEFREVFSGRYRGELYDQGGVVDESMNQMGGTPQNFYQEMNPKQAIEKATVDYNFALKKNNEGQADKIAGNLKAHLESLNYNWKSDAHALEILSDFLGENKIKLSEYVRKVVSENEFREVFSGRYRGELYDQGGVTENLREYAKKVLSEGEGREEINRKYIQKFLRNRDHNGIKMKFIGNFGEYEAYYIDQQGYIWHYYFDNGDYFWKELGNIKVIEKIKREIEGTIYDELIGKVSVTETSVLPVVKVKYMGEDDWSQPIYSKMDGKGIYVKVDGQLFTTTNEGEPYSKVNFTPEYVDEPINEDIGDLESDNTLIGKEQLKRFADDLKRSAKEEITVEMIGADTVYAFGSELACYRMYHPYRKLADNKAKIGFSGNRNSWFFMIQL